MDDTGTTLDQPAPIPNDTRPIWELVIEDMQERDRVGRARYGTPLQIHNGRNMLEDAYAEELDKIVYLKGAIEEAKWMRTELLALHAQLAGRRSLGEAELAEVVASLKRLLARSPA